MASDNRKVIEISREGALSPEVFAGSGIARLAILGQQADQLYPHNFLATDYQRLASAGVNVSYFVSFDPDKQRHFTATHNNEQACPNMKANSIEGFIASGHHR